MRVVSSLIVFVTSLFSLSFSAHFLTEQYSLINDSNSNSSTDLFTLEKSIGIEPEESIEGSVTILWDNSFGNRLELSYYITTRNGMRVELVPSPEIKADFQSFVSRHHYLNVNGVWDSEGSTFIVRGFNELTEMILNNDMGKIQSDSGWVINGSKITGNTPWITLLCKFPDVPEEPYDMDYYLKMYAPEYPGLDHYWREVSNNAINLAGSNTAGWYTLPSPSADYLNPLGYFNAAQAYEDCIAVSDSDIDYSQYYGVNLMFNQQIGTAFSIGGCGVQFLEGEFRDAGITWTFPGLGGGLANLAHEMGHGYCLPHSFVNDGVDPYRNYWDVMSDAYVWASSDPTYGYIPKHTIALNKYNLGWIDESNVLIVDLPYHQQITLGRTAQPLTNDYQMIKILMDENIYYTLETRHPILWYERDLPAKAVIIHKYDSTTGKISFIDANYDGVSGNEDDYWTVGETYIDPEYGLSFTIVEATETGFVINISYTELTPFENCLSQSSIPISECNALVSIYSALGGQNWISAPGWLVHPDPCIWAGVTCNDGVVVGLELLTELNGSLPYSIQDLTHLEILRLKSENLTGNIPASIGGLVNLQSLILRGNLTGSIPPELGNLNNLEKLDLRENQLSGNIPSELGSLGNLSYFDIFDNQITGSIPHEIGMLYKLESLRLSNNHLTGVLPPEIGNLSNVVSISIDNNRINGLIPMSITQLTNISSFSFRNTYLCEPDDPGYQIWKETYIPYNYFNDGAVCVEKFKNSFLPLIIK